MQIRLPIVFALTLLFDTSILLANSTLFPEVEISVSQNLNDDILEDPVGESNRRFAHAEDKYIRDLENTNADIRYHAIVDSGALLLTSEKGKVALKNALKDGDFHVRLQAALILARNHPKQHKADKDAVGLLIRELRQNNNEIREVILIKLRYLGSNVSEAIPTIRELLKQSDAVIRIRAAAALYFIDPTASADVILCLIKELQASNFHLRILVIETLGDLRASKDLIAALRTVLDKDNESIVRRYAARALGKLRDPTSLPSLIAALESSDLLVGAAAANAIGQYGAVVTKAGISSLIKALRSENPELRKEAVVALGRIGQPAKEVMPEIRQTLKLSSGDVKASAALALWAIDHTTANEIIPILVESLQNKDVRIRYIAVHALIEVAQDDNKAIAALRIALKDENSNIREFASTWLELLTDSVEMPARTK